MAEAKKKKSLNQRYGQNRTGGIYPSAVEAGYELISTGGPSKFRDIP